jgi:hypothetical protein
MWHDEDGINTGNPDEMSTHLLSRGQVRYAMDLALISAQCFQKMVELQEEQNYGKRDRLAGE